MKFYGRSLRLGFLYQDLEQGVEAKKAECFPNKCGLEIVGLSRVVFFIWEATWRKVLTLDHIQRRGWSLVNRCFLCLNEEESVDHILLHCDRTRLLWHLLFSLFGESWVLSSLVREALLGWHGVFVGKKRKKAWRVTPSCFFWTIWKERNSRAFDNEGWSIQGLKFSFIYKLWA